MHSYRFGAVALLLALMLGGGLAHAQREPSTASLSLPTAEGAALARMLERHGSARVRTHEGWFELTQPRLADRGAVAYLAARSIDAVGSGADLPQPLPLGEVSSIQLRTSAAGRGAVIGGVLAGAFALLGTLPFAAACDEVGAGAECGTGVVGAVLVVGAGGAGIGALIGASVKRWKTVYRAS